MITVLKDYKKPTNEVDIVKNSSCNQTKPHQLPSPLSERRTHPWHKSRARIHTSQPRHSSREHSHAPHTSPPDNCTHPTPAHQLPSSPSPRKGLTEAALAHELFALLLAQTPSAQAQVPAYAQEDLASQAGAEADLGAQSQVTPQMMVFCIRVEGSAGREVEGGEEGRTAVDMVAFRGWFKLWRFGESWLAGSEC